MAISMSCKVCLNSSLKQFLTRTISEGSITVGRLSQNATNAALGIPLSKPLLSVPKPIYATCENLNPETKVETLSNGLRVASQNKFGQSCAIGVVIDSGSRYEAAYPNGISHFLEKLAFNSTAEFEDKTAILQEFEKWGGVPYCKGTRDSLIYGAIANCRSLDPVIKLLSEAVLRPKLSSEEIGRAHRTIQFELEDLEMSQDQEPLLTEMIHAREKDLNLYLGPSPMSELAYFALGFESCSHQSPDFIPFCVLNMMLGGGKSFSAGGPGKGMYSRLYMNVLNRYPLNSAVAFNHTYNDTGLFCISATAHPSKLKDLVYIIVNEFKNITGKISH